MEEEKTRNYNKEYENDKKRDNYVLPPKKGA